MSKLGPKCHYFVWPSLFSSTALTLLDMIGLVAALATTSSGAAMGAFIEQLMSYGVVSLLWVLGIFTVLKLLMHTVGQFMCREWDCCGSLENSDRDCKTEQERHRVAVEIEQRIVTLDMEKTEVEKHEDRSDWEAQQRQREKIEKQYQKACEVEMKHRTSRQHLRKVIAKYMELWAFSGIPMTVTASVTAGFGIFGFGDYRFVFVILIVLVLSMSSGLMRSQHLNFWKFMGCMTMFSTFAIAVSCRKGGGRDVGKIAQAGQEISKENIIFRMTRTSSVEAISAGFYVTKVCQVGLGATVGGPMAREIEGKAVLGASVLAVLILLIVGASPLILGAGGTAGALLGVDGAAGVSMGAAAAVAGKSSSWKIVLINNNCV